MLIAIPVFRLSCSVTIDKGRAWSALEEAVLWTVSQKASSVTDLATQSGLKKQVVVAALSRLMRFRLVELSIAGDAVLFVASDYGREAVRGGRALPFFPKKEIKRVSFVIEHVTGGFFPSSQVRIVSKAGLEADMDSDKRIVVVENGAPVMSHEANLARLSQIAARGYDEQLANVDGRTASLRTEFMAIKVIDGVIRNLPENASGGLRAAIEKAAAGPENASIPVEYSGPPEEVDDDRSEHRINFAPEDLVIGGTAQRTLLVHIISSAHSRVIMHSTFLDHRRFKDLLPEIREACSRGVTFDLLWGAETSVDDQDNKNSIAAVEIANMVRQDRDVGRRFRVHMKTTGSHAKLLLADTESGDWVAAVGSCNWLSSPFAAVELTVVLRDAAIVADVAVALQRMVGRRGLSEDVATEMAFLAQELRRRPAGQGNATAMLIRGDHHDVMMRTGSGSAIKKVLAGSNRLGSTARPGYIIQAEAARERVSDLDITLLYTMASGPLKNRHARKLVEEAAANGVRLIRLERPPLHGKFLAWDEDDIAVTSLNWGSAKANDDFPEAEIGVHVHSSGIATELMLRIEAIFPSAVPARTEVSLGSAD